MSLDAVAVAKEYGLTLEEAIAAVEQAKKLAKTLPSITPEQMASAEFEARIVLGRDDSPKGYKHAFWCMTGMELPPHAEKDWIPALFAQKTEKKMGTIIEAAREMAKTIVITLYFTAWRIGLEPHRANVIIQVGDDIAKDNASKIAEVIEKNAGFRQIFPNVVPDKEKGWGDKGYEVRRTDMNSDDWNKLNSTRKDPTLVGLGYNSSAIIGKHPDGVLIIDDILDENNSSSDRELEGVKKILTGTIFYAITHDTWTIVIGTPWNERDVIAYCKATGEFICVHTPACTEDEDGITYTWPEQRGKEWVDRKRNTTPVTEFARMVLLDLSKVKSGVLKYLPYPYDRVNLSWACRGGVDYASTFKPTRNVQAGRSHFALAYVFKTPYNSFVVWDGILEQCSQAEAEAHIRNAQTMFVSWQGVVIEGDGKGEEFVMMLQRNPGIVFDMKKTGGKGKETRLERQMSPHFQSGRVMIADAQTKFLNALRYFFDNYPNIDQHHMSWDAADSVYWALRGFPEISIIPDTSTELPFNLRRDRTPSPWASLGAT